MSDVRSAAHLRDLVAFAVGLLVLAIGTTVRFLSPAQAGLHGAGALAAPLLAAAAFAAGVRLRPLHHRGVFLLPCLIAAAVGGLMLVLSLVDPTTRADLVPPALETLGGVVVVLATIKWVEAAIVGRHRWLHVNGQVKSELHHDVETSALVPASALVAQDEVRLKAGEQLPVDGFLSTDDGALDESLVMGDESPPVSKTYGEAVFAGTLARTPLRVVVAAAWGDSWAAQRDDRHDRMTEALLIPDRPARTAASAVALVAVATAGMAVTRAGPLAVALWMPTAAGVLLAAAAVVPAFGRLRVGLASLHGLAAAGLVVSRRRDLRALMRVRRWYFDSNLLLAPNLEIDPTALRSAERLGAALSPDRQDGAAMSAEAPLPLGETPPMPRDGTMLALESHPPTCGVYVRVLAPRAAYRLPEAAAPRLMRPSLASFARRWCTVVAYRRATHRLSWTLTGVNLWVAAGFALSVGLSPMAGAVISVVTIVLSTGRAPRFERLSDV